MIVVLTGASGFIGPRLIARLHKDGYTVRALGRRNPGIEGVEFAAWDALRAEPEPEALRDAGAIIHLAGEPVAQRWNPEVKRRIRDTRILGTRNLVSAIGKLKSRPGAMIAASAIGFYGDRGDELLPETAAHGQGFLPDVCVEWERESRHAGSFDLRVAILRIGIVLGQEGGALKQMLTPFRAGLGGPIGSGRQWVSWIHVDDIVEMLTFALRHEHVFGTLNATAPEAVRNSDFAKTLGAVLKRPAIVTAPAFGLRVMFGEMANVLLSSQRVVPEAAPRAGYVHKYPELRGALEQVLA